MDRIRRALRRAPQEQEPAENGDAVNDDTAAAAAASEGDQDDNEMSLEELLYSTASFHAIVKPVALTMILTALCVTYIYTPETLAATEQALSNSYVAFEAPEDASTAVEVGLSVTNALIIVSVIAAMTFVIVLLYKYRCMKFLMGYMVIASAALLGLLGGNMLYAAVQIYNLALDQFSYYFTLWNFAVVGTGAIFSPWGGIPMWITQGYLIATSVILAWQLAALDPWIAWALLVVLALYDLCAVLTPCGPLKALVNLMSEDDAPDMPGLLYEAELPPEAQRPGRRSTAATAQSSSTARPSRRSTAATVATTQSTTSDDNNTDNNVSNNNVQSTASAAAVVAAAAEEDSDESPVDSDVEALVPSSVRSSSSHDRSVSNGIEVTRTATDEEAPPPPFPTASPPASVTARLSQQTQASATTPAVTGTEQPRPRASIPFAIAKLYKLPLEEEEPVRRSSWTPLLEGEHLTPNELLSRQYTPEQLKAHVTAIFPRGGGRIESVGQKYMVKDRHGNVKRVLLLDDQGHIMEERRRTPEEEREEERKSNTIKLGLGDFIFYSVLVSKAALYSFTTFMACFLVILAGLGVTLVLLAVYHKALPALPISIMLGVLFYAATRWLIEPWYEAVLVTPYYV